MNLKQYYETEYEPWLPTNPKFRMFFFLKDGIGKKENIRTHNNVSMEENLRQLLITHLPDKAYYRTSCFLNPKEVKRKSKQDRFMFQDLTFDIDAPDLTTAKEDAWGLLDYLEDNGYPTPQLAYSGNKGFHVFIPEHLKYDEQKCLRVGKAILKDVREKGINVDKEVTGDTRRVIGLPNTIHAVTGNKREIIKIKDLNDFQPQNIAPGTLKANDGETHPQHIGRSADTGATHRPHFKMEMGSSILGVKNRHVFICHFPEYFTLKDVWKSLESKAKKLNLPHVYLFQFNHQYYAVCLKDMPLSQIKKENDSYYFKFRQEWLPLSEALGCDANKLILCEFREFIPTDTISRGHLLAFKSLGFPLPEFRKPIGNSKTKLFKGENDGHNTHL